MADESVMPEDKQLTIGEVARKFRVDPKTVGRWCKAGKLTFTRTVGGHKRFSEAYINAYIAGTREEARLPFSQRQSAA